MKDFSRTHDASDHDVEADGKGFVESPELGAVLCLEILCKPECQSEDDMRSRLKSNMRKNEFSPRIWRRLPEVVAFGDGVLCKWCI